MENLKINIQRNLVPLQGMPTVQPKNYSNGPAAQNFRPTAYNPAFPPAPWMP